MGNRKILMKSLTGWCLVILVAATGLASGAPDGLIVKPLINPSAAPGGGSNAVVGTHGTVQVEKKGKLQRFVVQVKNGPQPGQGFGVFLDNTATISDAAVFVNLLSARGSTNGNWRLVLENKTGGAPPFLGGIIDVNELVGKFVFVADQSTNVSLLTLVTPLVPHPSSLSFSKQTKLTTPQPAPSPHATGRIRARYNGNTGASVLEVRVHSLAAGNTYCCIFTASSTPPWPVACSGGDTLVQGGGLVRIDTSKGEDLPGGVADGFTTVADLGGVNVFILDAFGVVHLQGTIPSAPKPSSR